MAKYTDFCSSAIAKNLEPECDNIITPGLEQLGIIVNLADCNPVKNGNIITDLGMAESKTGYYIYQMGSQPFSGTKTSLTTGTVFNTFTHTVQFVLLNNSPSVCADIIDQLSNGSFGVIVQNKFNRTRTGTQSTIPVYKSMNKFQCYGFESGLKATAIECDKYSDETNSGWLITLTEEKATKSAWFFYTTDDEATQTAFEALASPTVYPSTEVMRM